MAFLSSFGQKVWKMGDDLVHGRSEDARSAFSETVASVPGLSHTMAGVAKVTSQIKTGDDFWQVVNSNDTVAIVKHTTLTGLRFAAPLLGSVTSSLLSSLLTSRHDVSLQHVEYCPHEKDNNFAAAPIRFQNWALMFRFQYGHKTFHFQAYQDDHGHLDIHRNETD